MIHPTAQVEDGAQVGPHTSVWHFAHIRAGAIVGANCNIGDNAYVDAGAVIGNGVKLQNRVSVYRGVTLEDGVFVGPHVAFSNDLYPRSIKADGSIVKEGDWTLLPTLVKYGASIGGGSVILPGLTIGRWAMVGANALVTEDVPDHALVYGSPARHVGYVCCCGRPLEATDHGWYCSTCKETYDLPRLADD